MGNRFPVKLGRFTDNGLGDSMSMRWYVVHAYSGYEKKVALAIQDRLTMHNLQDRFGEILVPTEEVV